MVLVAGSFPALLRASLREFNNLVNCVRRRRLQKCFRRDRLENNCRSNEGEKHVMNDTHDIRLQEALLCALCGRRGVTLYQGLQDRLFRVPGRWSLLRCSWCCWVWLHPRPIRDDVGKLYSEYFTHAGHTSTVSRGIHFLRDRVKYSILCYSFGYEIREASRMLGWVASHIPFLRETIGLGIMWLEASRRGRLLDVGCGNGEFLARMRHLGSPYNRRCSSQARVFLPATSETATRGRCDE